MTSTALEEPRTVDETHPDVDTYLQVCGASDLTRRELHGLAQSMGPKGYDPKTEALDIKRELQRRNFTYISDTVRPQDVLSKHGGNCVGLPFLIASVMHLRGHSAGFLSQRGIHDATRSVEVDSARYAPRDLASVQRKTPFGRYAPLEHLVLDIDGFPIECTTVDWEPSDCESQKPLSYREGIGCVLQTLASQATADGQLSLARELTDKSLSLWPKNQSLHHLSAIIADSSFDDKRRQEALERFQAIGGDDSYVHHTMFHITGKQEHLQTALEKYPTYAQALAEQAGILAKSEPEEARRLLSLSSHMYADSSVMKLVSFYTGNLDTLVELFGKRRIAKQLASFEDTQRFDNEVYWGDFQYHATRYLLTGKQTELAELRESVETPKQRLSFVEFSRGTPLYDAREDRFLESEFGNSTIYQKSKKHYAQQARRFRK